MSERVRTQPATHLHLCMCVCGCRVALTTPLPFLFVFALGAESRLTPTQGAGIGTEGGRIMTPRQAFQLDAHGPPTCLHPASGERGPLEVPRYLEWKKGIVSQMFAGSG